MSPVLCHTCLSAGRVLRAMHYYADVFWRVVGPIDLDVSQLLICWECEALLRSVVRFQNKVHTANSVLGLFGPTGQASSLSNLAIIELTSIVCDNEIKVEKNEPIIQETTKSHSLMGQVQASVETATQEYYEPFSDDYDDFLNTANDTPSDNIIKVEVDCVEIKKEKPAARKPKKKEERDYYIKEKPKVRQKKSSATRTYYLRVSGSAAGTSRFSKVTLNETELLEMLMKERESEFFKDRKYKCKDCIIGFQTKGHMLLHKKRHKKSAGQYKCEVCKTRYQTQPLLAEHIKSHYVKLVCNACAFECYAVTRMMLHHNDNHMIDSYVCTKCEVKFLDKSECIRHYRSTHIDYCCECDYCGKRLKSKYGLRVHMKSRHSEIKCGECGALSGSLRELKEHLKAAHAAGGSTAKYCVECDKQFVNDFSYQNHLERTIKHGGPTLLRYPCDSCDMWFRSPGVLRSHRDSVHLKIKRHRCDDCGMKFAWRYNLYDHRRARHEPRLPTADKTCQVCGKLFTTKKSLSRHLLIHTGERPFSCPHCPSTFNQNAAMRNHVRKVHNMEPPATKSTVTR